MCASAVDVMVPVYRFCVGGAWLLLEYLLLLNSYVVVVLAREVLHYSSIEFRVRV